MRRGIVFLAVTGMLWLSACAKKESTEAPQGGEAAPAAAAQPAGGPHAFVNLKDGSKVGGTIVASTQTEMIVAGDDGIERKIPMAQVKSVEYGEAQAAPAAQQAAREPGALKKRAAEAPARAREGRPGQAAPQTAQKAAEAPAAAPAPAAAAPPPAPVMKTYEVPAGTDLSVRTNEAIDSATAAEGQTFDAQITRDVRDAAGAVVIPRGANARVVIKSASKGGRFRGASDLLLDLQSVAIHGKQYTVEATDIGKQGKAGIGANKRTATYTGGGAALGAIIGAIAGGGKGAAIGAGAGAGAGALTQIITKGGSIKVPAESVLTFQLEGPLRVTAE